MPKFYKQWKEFLKETRLPDGTVVAGDWPDSPERRARDLAQKGLEAAASGAPWIGPDKPGCGLTDASLTEADFDILERILERLTIGVGVGNLAQRFSEIMEKLGVSLGAQQDSQSIADWGHADVDADQMEDSLHAFHDAAGKAAWSAKKDKGPRGIS